MNEVAQLNRAPPGISCEGIAPTNSPPRRGFLSSLGISCEGIAPINSPPQGGTAGGLCAGVHVIARSPAGEYSGPARGEEGIAPTPGTRGSGGVTKQQYQQR